MEPRIQYVRTSDGVNIAYAKAGNGRPLIAMPGPMSSHVELIWEMYPSLLPSLASTFEVVWYDTRGSGRPRPLDTYNSILAHSRRTRNGSAA